MIAPFAEGMGRLAAAVVIALCAATVPVAAQSGPFSGLRGQWSGAGHIELEGGTRERIRCRATYQVSGNGRTMHQALRCASDSYNFELRSDVESHGNQISGNWSELTRNVGGILSGHARRGRIEVAVKSATFNAQLILTSHGNRQSVTIQSKGTQFTGVSIKLSRRG
jgi:hypothetical protein